MLSFQRVQWFFRFLRPDSSSMNCLDASYVVYYTNYGHPRNSQVWMIPGTNIE